MVILKSLNPIFVTYNSARKNPNTSANPQHLDLFPVLSGTLPSPGPSPFKLAWCVHTLCCSRMSLSSPSVGPSISSLAFRQLLCNAFRQSALSNQGEHIIIIMIFIGRNPGPRYLVARRENKLHASERRSKIFGSSK